MSSIVVLLPTAHFISKEGQSTRGHLTNPRRAHIQFGSNLSARSLQGYGVPHGFPMAFVKSFQTVADDGSPILSLNCIENLLHDIGTIGPVVDCLYECRSSVPDLRRFEPVERLAFDHREQEGFPVADILRGRGHDRDDRITDDIGCIRRTAGSAQDRICHLVHGIPMTLIERRKVRLLG
ncbi:hypothetical protein BIU82_04565 [Arthrobacter sp. SW1]|nr:hypothetical protein BIU82_04565 [Arthrobacter sp. SW1]